jgi:hypothetical protein
MPPIPARGIGGFFVIVAALLSPSRAHGCATADCASYMNDLYRTVDLHRARSGARSARLIKHQRDRAPTARSAIRLVKAALVRVP